jgi:hypothetical protein
VLRVFLVNDCVEGTRVNLEWAEFREPYCLVSIDALRGIHL